MFLFVYAIGYTYKDSLEFSILETQIQIINLPAHFFILQWRKFVSVELLMTCWKEKCSLNICAVFITKRWLQTTDSLPSTQEQHKNQLCAWGWNIYWGKLLLCTHDTYCHTGAIFPRFHPRKTSFFSVFVLLHLFLGAGRQGHKDD